MKLRNKLIPMISVASLTATIAPISLTSCNCIQMTNLVNGYKPTIQRATPEGDKATKESMLELYGSTCEKNIDVFKQDLFWTKATQYLFAFDRYKIDYGIRIEPEALKASLDNVKINKRICQSEDKSEYTYYTIDFDYVFNLVYKSYGMYVYIKNGTYLYGFGEGQHQQRLSLQLKNIPITINRKGTTAKNIDSSDSFYDECFKNKSFMTDWVIQIDCDYDFTSTRKWVNHTAFTHLQNNGFDFSFKIENDILDIVKPTKTGVNEKYVSNFSYDFNKDSSFDKALIDADKVKNPNESLEMYVLSFMKNYYIASYHLSDIVDSNNQLWGQ